MLCIHILSVPHVHVHRVFEIFFDNYYLQFVLSTDLSTQNVHALHNKATCISLWKHELTPPTQYITDPHHNIYMRTLVYIIILK